MAPVGFTALLALPWVFAAVGPLERPPVDIGYVSTVTGAQTASSDARAFDLFRTDGAPAAEPAPRFPDGPGLLARQPSVEWPFPPVDAADRLGDPSAAFFDGVGAGLPADGSERRRGFEALAEPSIEGALGRAVSRRTPPRGTATARFPAAAAVVPGLASLTLMGIGAVLGLPRRLSL